MNFFLSTKSVLWRPRICRKCVCGRFCPWADWGAHDAPQTPSRLGMGHPSPDPTQLGAFGASTSGLPLHIISGYATGYIRLLLQTINWHLWQIATPTTTTVMGHLLHMQNKQVKWQQRPISIEFTILQTPVCFTVT